jgi:hypothetical protein
LSSLLVQAEPKAKASLLFLWLGLLVLGALAYLNCFSQEIYRVSMADETIYLRNGLRFSAASFDNYELFPLHSAWYALLHQFVEDPITLFKLSAVLQLSLLVLLVVLVTQALGRVPIVAFGFGMALLATPILGVSASPFSQRSALIVVLLGVALASRVKDPLLRAIPIGLTFLVASFARSEFILAFYLVSLGLALYVLLGHRDRAGIRCLGIYALCVLSFSLLLNFPVLADSKRSMMAFGQHYAVQLQSEGVDIDPWLHWREAMADTFGGSTSIQGALWANPTAFFGHLVWSAKGLLVWAKELHLLSLFLLVFSLGACLRYGLGLWRRLRAQRDAGLEADAVLWVALALGMLPILISIFLVAPRNHYLQQFYVMASLLGALSLGGTLRIQPLPRSLSSGKPLFAVLAALIVFSVPAAPNRPDRNASIAIKLRDLTDVERETRPHVFSMFRGLSVYIFDDCKEIYFTYWKPEVMPLQAFLERGRFDYIYLDEQRIAMQADDMGAALSSFVADPEGHGYRLIHTEARALIYERSAPFPEED